MFSLIPTTISVNTLLEYWLDHQSGFDTPSIIPSKCLFIYFGVRMKKSTLTIHIFELQIS